MVYLIHGDDTQSSRNYYLSLKEANSIVFDAEDLSLIELAQAIKGSGLFHASNKIFIENLFTRKGTKNFDEVIEIINESNNLEVFLWSNKEIPNKIIKDVKNIEPKLFKIPQNIWFFLDNLRPNNKNNVIEFHKALTSSEPEFIVSMLTRQFRLLLGIKSSSENRIDEVKRLAPWQKSKLISQSKLFTTSKLRIILSKLYEIDKNTKTGKTNFNLTQNIDILLLEI